MHDSAEGSAMRGPDLLCGRGREAELPAGVDACGENGEFHSFVYAGPIFSESIAFSRGETVVREGRFHFCDLVPAYQGRNKASP